MADRDPDRDRYERDHHREQEYRELVQQRRDDREAVRKVVGNEQRARELFAEVGVDHVDSEAEGESVGIIAAALDAAGRAEMQAWEDDLAAWRAAVEKLPSHVWTQADVLDLIDSFNRGISAEDYVPKHGAAALDAAEQRGAAAERARVVAYLRAVVGSGHITAAIEAGDHCAPAATPEPTPGEREGE